MKLGLHLFFGFVLAAASFLVSNNFASAGIISGVTVTSLNVQGGDLVYGARLTDGVKSLNTGNDGDDWGGNSTSGGVTVVDHISNGFGVKIVAEFDLQSTATLDRIDVSYMSAVNFAVPKPGSINVWFSNTAGVFNMAPDVAYDSAADPGFTDSNAGWLTVEDAPMALSGVGRYVKMEFNGGIWNGVDKEWMGITEVQFNQALVLNQWNVDADGAWSLDTNWTPDAPTTAAEVANFAGAITAPRTVTLDGNQTVESVRFDNANKYTVAGTDTLTLAGSAPFAVVSGSHEISTPVVVNAGVILPVPTGAALTLSGPVTSAAGITKSDAGTASLTSSSNDISGNVVVTGGVLNATSVKAGYAGNISASDTGVANISTATAGDLSATTGGDIIVGDITAANVTASGVGSVVSVGNTTANHLTATAGGKIVLTGTNYNIGYVHLDSSGASQLETTGAAEISIPKMYSNVQGAGEAVFGTANLHIGEYINDNPTLNFNSNGGTFAVPQTTIDLLNNQGAIRFGVAQSSLMIVNGVSELAPGTNFYFNQSFPATVPGGTIRFSGSTGVTGQFRKFAGGTIEVTDATTIPGGNLDYHGRIITMYGAPAPGLDTTIGQFGLTTIKNLGSNTFVMPDRGFRVAGELQFSGTNFQVDWGALLWNFDARFTTPSINVDSGLTVTLNAHPGFAGGKFDYAIGVDGTTNADMNFAKRGDGTLVVAGPSSYTGLTTVEAGTLVANNATGSATGPGSVVVNAGATLGGGGFIDPTGANFVTVNGNVAPGNSIGVLTVLSDLTLGGTYIAEVSSAPAADLLDVEGILTLGGGSILNLPLTNSYNAGATYTLAEFASLSGLFGTVQNLPGTHTLTYGLSSIQLTPVPEPSSLMLLGGGLVGMVSVIRRRRSQV